MVFLSCHTAFGQGLKDALGSHFLVSVALNAEQVSEGDPLTNTLVERHFNAVVAENCMKVEELQPREGEFNFRAADSLVEYAQEHHLALTGHVLVWHSQTPQWMFENEDGTPCSRERLISRMQTHIRTVVGHFRGKVRGWDVVNEMMEDDGTLRRSPYLEIIGPEYIEMALRIAHEADPDAELYLNDYSMSNPKKREAYIRLIRQLKEKGVRLDAIGMQSHVGLNYPDLSDYEASIEAFAREGVKVMITELDMSVLPNPFEQTGAEVSLNFEYREKMDPYRDGIPADVEQRITNRWVQLFSIYRRHQDDISRVNLWGLHDGQSWLNDWPIHGRTNYGLLFDRQLDP